MKRYRFQGKVRCSRFCVSTLVPGTLNTLKREQRSLPSHLNPFPSHCACIPHSDPLF